MTQFKVGDRVRAGEDGEGFSLYYTAGDTGTVKELDHHGHLWVLFDEDNYHSNIVGWNDRFWCVNAEKAELLEAGQ